MRFYTLAGAAATFACLGSPVASGQVRLTEIANIDLSSTADPMNAEFIGSNPSAIAWDGTDLYAAGFNGSGASAPVGIVRIQDALGAATAGIAFGVQTAPNLRGYSGLDVSGSSIAAAYDSGGSDPEGVALYDATGAQLWSKEGRAGSGVAFNPGFPGGNPALGSGVAWATFGSGRARLQDAVTGADIYDGTNGFVIFTSEGTFFRDMDFEDATGDCWVREANNVLSFTRSGDNAVTGAQVVFDAVPDQDFVAGQNIAHLQGADLVIYNNRTATGAGQDFFSVVNVIDEAGAVQAVDWGGFTPPTGVGFYDFSYDAATGTLAILDFSARSVSIFSLATGGVATNFCMAAVNSSGVAASLVATGSAQLAANDLVLTCIDMPAESFAIFTASLDQDFVPMAGGGEGNLCLGGAIGRGVGGQVYNSGSAGSVTASVDWTSVPQPGGPVAAMIGDQWNFQCWFRDLGVSGSATFNYSDGVSVDVR